jgi:hypothetical protein
MKLREAAIFGLMASMHILGVDTSNAQLFDDCCLPSWSFLCLILIYWCRCRVAVRLNDEGQE